MNKHLNKIFILFFLCTTFVSIAQKQKKSIFFTKEDQNNWVYVMNDKNLQPDHLFKMEDGLLKISNVSTGYLRSKKVYKNFTLSLEWRWTQSLANSGVLVYIQPKDSIWPVCYQVQQKAGAAGDIICMNGLWAKECKDSVKFTVPKQQSSNEKTLGEWNSMKIKSHSGKLIVSINGVLQNKITKMTAQEGFIGFQAEGKPVEFRNLRIK